MYVRNIDGKKSEEKHWILLFIERNTAAYFDSFGIKYISQKMLNKNIDQSITRNIFIIQSDDSFMCVLYCIASIEYILSAKTVLHDTYMIFILKTVLHDIYFIWMTIKRMGKYHVSILRTTMSHLEFRLKK